jgi:hypothetical protein
MHRLMVTGGGYDSVGRRQPEARWRCSDVDRKTAPAHCCPCAPRTSHHCLLILGSTELDMVPSQLICNRGVTAESNMNPRRSLVPLCNRCVTAV